MSVLYYVNLLAFNNRIEAFQRGIAEAVRPGDRVLDVGTGLGTFAFFAVRSGAERVVAVDADPVLHLAETVAMANGLTEKVDFVRGSAPSVPAPGEFDVIIFEDFPTSLLDQRTFAMLRRLQDEHLSAGGRMVPSAARLCLAPVHSPPSRAETFPLDDEGYTRFGLDWSALRPLLVNVPRRVTLSSACLRGEAACGPRLPLLPLPKASDLRVEGSWDAAEAGTVDGLAIWFELEVHEDGWISNAPRENAEPWGQVLLPVDPPLEIAAAQTVQAAVWREELDDGSPGFMVWECRVAGEMRRGHEFAGKAVGLEDLAPSGEPSGGCTTAGDRDETS